MLKLNQGHTVVVEGLAAGGGQNKFWDGMGKTFLEMGWQNILGNGWQNLFSQPYHQFF